MGGFQVLAAKWGKMISMRQLLGLLGDPRGKISTVASWEAFESRSFISAVINGSERLAAVDVSAETDHRENWEASWMTSDGGPAGLVERRGPLLMLKSATSDNLSHL